MAKRQINRLTDSQCRAAGDGQHNDGNGLYLRVAKSGVQKSWTLRFALDGKPVMRGIGSFPGVSLADARKAAAMLRAGNAPDKPPAPAPHNYPSGSGKAAYTALQHTKGGPASPTFAAVADATITAWAPTWRNTRQAAQWRAMLETYAGPIIGTKPIDTITPADVTAVLEPIWLSKPETATRLKQRLATVFDYSIGHGLRDGNPVPRKMAALPRRKRQRAHFTALPYTAVPGALAAIRDSGALPATRLALQLLIHTAARAGEIRGATWAEVDIENRLWVVPSDRMKMARCHRVPLSDRAVEILIEARQLTDGDGLIFPAKSGKPLSDMCFVMLLRRLGIPCVAHGFRSSFKDWCLESGKDWAASENALAHQLGDAVAASYARSDMLEQRRALMTEWADYVGTQVC